MCNLLASSLICLGALGYTPALDGVAERRHAAAWGGLSGDPAGYEVLLGVEDCSLLGRRGYLVVGDELYTAIVADCNQAAHPWPVGYLGDVNLEAVGYEWGYLILPPGRARWWYEERH